MGRRGTAGAVLERDCQRAVRRVQAVGAHSQGARVSRVHRETIGSLREGEMTRVITQLINAFGVAAAYSMILPPNKCVCMIDGTHTQDCTIR